MNVAEVLAELESLGSPQTVKIYRNHGASGEMFGVKVGDLKQVLKKIKGDQKLALELWETGNSDAMYLASLTADGSRMTRKQLDGWAKSAWWYLLSEYAVPFVATEHRDAFKIGRKWIHSQQPHIASSGWSTYAATISVRPDAEIDLSEIAELLEKIESEITAAAPRVRYCMNGFVICAGSYAKPLLKMAKATAKKIGKVEVDVGATACKVPLASETILKIEKMGRIGHKRKTAKC